MSDREPGGGEVREAPPMNPDAATAGGDAGTSGASASAPTAGRAGRSASWWVTRVALVTAVSALVLVVAGLLVYDYGTMWPPSAEAEAQYQALVTAGKAPPELPPPGPRIPIPGCVCHADDADLTKKAPGHIPDPTIVVAHRYRTLRECFTQGCHGGGEATEGRVPGEPANPTVIPPQ